MTTLNGGASIDGGLLRSYIRSVYDTGKVVGEGGKEFSIRPHGVPESDGAALRDLAQAERAVHTIETGLCFGLSTMFLCEAIAASGRADARHVAIDPKQPTWDNAGLRAIREAGVENLVEFHGRGSEFVLPQLLREGRVFDLAFVDGDHRFEGVFVDVYFLGQLIKPGGLIVVDDVWMPAVRLAVSYFVANFGLEVEPVAVSGPVFTGEPAFLREQVKAAPRARMAVLRRPVEPPKRPWNHFVPFADWETARSPLAAATRSATQRMRALAGAGRGRGREGGT